MKITVDNWKSVERAIREVGVRDTIYDPQGVIQTIIPESGECYELTKEVIQQLLKSGRVDVKLGRRIDTNIR